MAGRRQDSSKGGNRKDVAGAEKTGKKKKYGKLLAAALFLGGFVLPVKAAPAALTASSAVVYEQMSEESAPLQNLIQDERFEHLGDVTAEDGSLWHAVTTAGGISGYIRGDIEIRAQQTQQETPEHTESEETQGSIAVEEPEQNGAEENAEGDGEEEAEETALPQIIENNRTKTYAVEALGKKIKNRADAAGEYAAEDQRAQNEGKKNHDTDRTFLLCIIVTLFSVVGALTFHKKLRKESGKQKKDTPQEAAVKKNPLRNERKRRKSKHKRSKKHRKRQNETLQKHP